MHNWSSSISFYVRTGTYQCSDGTTGTIALNSNYPGYTLTAVARGIIDSGTATSLPVIKIGVSCSTHGGAVFAGYDTAGGTVGIRLADAAPGP